MVIKTNDGKVCRPARDEWGGFLHVLALDAHEHLPHMLYERLWYLGGIVVHIIAFEPVGVVCGALTHDFDGASVVGQFQDI